MITVSDVSLKFSEKPLFKDVNLKFTSGNCYGIIGANGAGKSTFLKVLSGELEHDNGTITITPGERMAVLRQDHFAFDAFSVKDTVMQGYPKLYETAKARETIYEKRERVLIFTQYKEIIPFLKAYLEDIFGCEGLVIHGGVPVKKRQKLVEQFNGEAYVPFMILSLKAGGTGLNLTAANHVIHFDRWWNPAVENQATDRAYRIGQNKSVIVHKFVAKGTIEEKISGLLSLRSGLYESSADFILDTAGLSPEQIAGQIRRIVSRRYRAVIFDLDGTLLATLEDLACAVEHALQKRGFPGHSIQEYRGMVGHGVRNLVIRALPGQLQENQELVDACLSDFKDYYRSHIDVHTHPYPGMPELLGRLRQEGVRLCVASNKFQEGVEHLVKEFFPDITFSAILGDRPGKALKPDPQIVREALAAAGVDISDCVMAGDSATDMKTAAAAGIDAIAVNWGYRSLEASPDYLLIHSAEELGMALL